ncbi:hypothetical protein FI667_g7458, partial [Globisporangium splendens]
MHQAVRERPEENERQRLREHARKDERQRVRVEVHFDVHAQLENPRRDGRDDVGAREEREARQAREPDDARHAAGDDAHRRVDEVGRLLVLLHVLHGEELHVLALQFVHRHSL